MSTFKIEYIVVHHSAGGDVQMTQTKDDIDAQHKKKWSGGIGYHKVIQGDGTIEKGRDETKMGAHCKAQKMNYKSLGVCLTGNFDRQFPTTQQINSLVKVLVEWCKKHNVSSNNIHGHNHWESGKACPGKNVISQLPRIKKRVADGVLPPRYKLEKLMKDEHMRYVLRKVIGEGDSKISLEDAHTLVHATFEDFKVEPEEIESLKAILKNAKSLDNKTRLYLDDFLKNPEVFMERHRKRKQDFAKKLTKNFSRSEFDCKDGTIVPAEYMDNVKELAANLQVLRDKTNKSITVVRGYHSQKYNKSLGFSSKSAHLIGKAADISVAGHSAKSAGKLIEKLMKKNENYGDRYMKKGKVSIKNKYVHYETT